MSGQQGQLAALRAEGLAVGYDGERVVEGIELALGRGETLALVGANGSGKTTLLKAMAGLIQPLAGELRVFGAAPLSEPARVAYLGQFHPSGFVLPLRAYEVVRMGVFAARGLLGRIEAKDENAVAAAMESVGIADLADKPLNELSGGQRQRVFIAQALARGAELLLLDEPEANLDAASREVSRRVFAAAVEGGAAAVIATHDIKAAEACDYTMLLARRLVAYGPSAEVLRAEALLETFGVVGRTGDDRLVVLEREHGHDGCEHED